MTKTFLPPRRAGMIFHLACITALVLGAALSLEQALLTEFGPRFLVALAGFLGLAAPILLLAYRAYSLSRASYTLSPNALTLHWGFRSEEIPMHLIRWVRLATEMEKPLPLPFIRWPGAVVGVRRAGQEEVEYLAARMRGLVVIATPARLYAISPVDPAGFVHTFHRMAEMGSLQPIPGRSLYPTFLIGSVFSALPARYLLLAGLTFSLAFLIWVVVLFPPQAGSLPGSRITPTQLLLLPILNAFFYLGDLALGIFFFRRPQTRPLAYLLWGASLVAGAMFLTAAVLARGIP